MKSVLFSLYLIVISVSISAKDNPFTIDSISFDNKLLRFKIAWHADSVTLSQNIQYGIAVTCIKSNNDPPVSRFKLTNMSADTIVTIQELVYDTTYFIGIWAYYGEMWFKPDSQSIKKVFVSSISTQPVSMFAPAKVSDTIKALSNKVILWKDSSFHLGIPPHQDTVIAFLPPDSLLKGFIRLSTGIRFAHPEPSLPFFIALAIDSIPSKCRSGQIHIYRDSSGLFIPEDSSHVDIKNMQVSIKTGNVRLPFIVLADTAPPVISIKSDTSLIIDSITVYDTVLISDNSSNLSWSFYRSPGSELLGKPLLSGTIKGISGRIICPFTAVGAQTNGIRAALIYTDGTFKDTINLSKRGLRNHSDPVTIPEKKIIPVSTISQLDNPGIRSSLKPLFDQSGGYYNQSHFRIYRWIPDNSNVGISNKWIEYSSKNENLFSLTPGMMIWLICDKSQMIDLGKGTTVSLKDTISIVLPSRNWTDLNNPFGFNLRLTDILRSSGIAAEDLTIYKWIEDKANGTYQASLVYSNAITGIDSLHDTLYAMQSGYTVYNRTNSSLVMRMQSIPYSPAGSSAQLLKKVKQNRVTIRITAKTGDKELGAVYCGIHNISNDTFSCPLPPSFGSQSILIRGQAETDSSGILSYPFSDSIPAVFNLEVKCKDRDTKVNVVGDLLSNDFGTEFALFTKTKNGLEPFSENQATFKDGQGSFVLVIGGVDAINSFRGFNSSHTMIKPSVNIIPLRGMIGLEMSGIAPGICSFELFSLLGKRVYSQQFAYTSDNSKLISTKFLPGIYLAKLKFTDKDRIVFSTVRKFSFFNEGL